MKHIRRITLPLLLLALIVSSGFSSCGIPKPKNPTPNKLDTPTETLNGIVSGTHASEQILKSHHNARQQTLFASAKVIKDQAIPADVKKAQLIAIQMELNAETDKFQRFNVTYKKIVKYEMDAANALKTIAASGDSTQSAVDKIKLASNLVVTELLGQIDDPELRDSLVQLNVLMQRLIGTLGGGR